MFSIMTSVEVRGEGDSLSSQRTIQGGGVIGKWMDIDISAFHQLHMWYYTMITVGKVLGKVPVTKALSNSSMS